MLWRMVKVFPTESLAAFPKRKTYNNCWMLLHLTIKVEFARESYPQ